MRWELRRNVTPSATHGIREKGYMPLDETFIKKAVQAEAYELSLHADEERLHDHLTIKELEAVLLSCELL